MRITLIQTDIAWEDKLENLRRLHLRLKELKGETDLVVLPETFTTGFSMNVEQLAEPMTGPTIKQLQQWASQYGTALAGSFIAHHDDGSYRNRFFFLTPEGEATYYDKHHLFRMGHENECFTAGNERPIICYRGSAFCLKCATTCVSQYGAATSPMNMTWLSTWPAGLLPAELYGTSCSKREPWRTSATYVA